MSVLQDEQLEFASPEWLALLRRLLLAKAYCNPTGPVLATCEVYRGVPPHLAPDGSDRLAWTRRVVAGVARVDPEEAADSEVDVKLVGDYEALRPLARFIVTPETEAEFSRLMAEAIEQGRITLVRSPGAADPPADYTIHNLIGALTR